MFSINRIYNFSFLLIAIFPILGLKKAVIPIIIWSFISALIFIKNKNYQFVSKRDWIAIAMFSMYFWMYVPGLFFSEEPKIILSFLEKKAAFLLFPLIAILNRREILPNMLQKSLVLFSASNITTSVWVWSKIANNGFANTFEEDHFYNPIIRNYFSDTTETHLPYLGIFYVFSIFILLKLIFENKINGLQKFFSILGVSILLISIVAFSARMSIFILFIGLIYLFFKFKISRRHKFILSVFLLLSSLSILFLPSSKRRIDDLFTNSFQLPSQNQNPEHANIRFGILNCDISLIKENFLFGYDISQTQNLLDQCYSQYQYKGLNDFQQITYNSHNQYFDTILKWGFLGFLIFLISIFWQIKNPNKSYQFFFIIILISMLTENVLDRQAGVLFFTYFNTLFYLKKESQNLFKKNNYSD
ncbi:MAG: O-antigen ligase family protein [Flavobacterium sp.]